MKERMFISDCADECYETPVIFEEVLDNYINPTMYDSGKLEQMESRLDHLANLIKYLVDRLPPMNKVELAQSFGYRRAK